MAFARRRGVAGQAAVAPARVDLGALGRPVGRNAQSQQFLGREAHHAAEGRVHIADAALQIARAQARDQRVLHGLAKGQRIAQIALGAQASAVVAHQHGDHGHQGDGHQRHQGREHVGEYAGRAVPAVHAQHQGAARQVQQLLRREHARAAPGGAQQGQARAVRLGEGHFLGARQVLADLGDQQALQAVGADDKADDVAALRQWQADLHHLRAQAFGQQLEVAGRVGRAVEAARVGAGQHGLRMGVLRAQLVFPLHVAVGRLGMGADLQARIAPFDAHQLAAHLQQLGGAGLPLGRVVVGRVQRLQVLQVAVEGGAYVGHGIGGVALQLVLDLGGLIASGQPDHGDEHAGHQSDQQAPQRPAPPGSAPAAPGPAAFGRGGRGQVQRIHRTRCSRAGNWRRTCARRSRLISPSTTPAPSACCASTMPQGSASRLWPQVRRPFSWWPPWAGASR